MLVEKIRGKNIRNHCSCNEEERECVEEWWGEGWDVEGGREREAAGSCSSEWAVQWWRGKYVRGNFLVS